MDQNIPFPEGFSIQQAMQLANSPAGRQLLSTLQQQGGTDFQKAMSDAASGNYDQAKQAVSGLLADPKIQALLKQLGG